jgi:hypothetical protein
MGVPSLGRSGKGWQCLNPWPFSDPCPHPSLPPCAHHAPPLLPLGPYRKFPYPVLSHGFSPPPQDRTRPHQQLLPTKDSNSSTLICSQSRCVARVSELSKNEGEPCLSSQPSEVSPGPQAVTAACTTLEWTCPLFRTLCHSVLDARGWCTCGQQGPIPPFRHLCSPAFVAGPVLPSQPTILVPCPLPGWSLSLPFPPSPIWPFTHSSLGFP